METQEDFLLFLQKKIKILTYSFYKFCDVNCENYFLLIKIYSIFVNL